MIRTNNISVLILLLLTVTSCSQKIFDPDPGVSYDLAEYRASRFTDIKYDISLSIPEHKSDPINGTEEISFDFEGGKNPVVIDFRESRDKLISVTVRKKRVEYIFQNEHIIIPAKFFRRGKNTIELTFVAGNQSLNRNDDFLYTLFVPDRARTAFPCFDQPDMKASFQLQLEIPEDWTAVANGKLVQQTQGNGRKVMMFDRTEPLSTYLFAFVAGKFSKITRERNGKKISLYHRENDTKKVDSNVDAIYDMVYQSLDWLETYTGIDYPFAKYDLIAIPSFQYGGMEHTGATLYRSSKLFLEESATQEQLLDRAQLIAHETAHMWFGDYVTMKWFNDVWLKEVFANFMAGKIVNPMFPNVDHRLRFLLDHYPAAYSVDRTQGANPIGQPLDNLKDAGTLYGSIIYHKAPIVMNHLEQMIGAQNLREGLMTYLKKYAYGNATWDNLIEILNEDSPFDLKEWSNVWVYEPGMPRIEVAIGQNDSIRGGYSFSQVDPWGYNRLWKQRLNFLFGSQDESKMLPYNFNGPEMDVNIMEEHLNSDFVLPNGLGLAYGYFSLDAKTLEYLLRNVPFIPEGLTRGVVWLDLYENMLNAKVAPHEMLDAIMLALPQEKDQQLINLLNKYIRTIYWKLLVDQDRNSYMVPLEKLLWSSMERNPNASIKRDFFNTWKSIVMSKSGIEKLLGVWDGSVSIDGLVLSENDKMELSFDLAVRNVKNARQILVKQLRSIKNADRKKKMEFIIPALSTDALARDAFFESLKDGRNREIENWVTTALRYLHHPLRARTSEKYLKSGLDMLEDIQVTGDIFFPKAWLDSSLGQYSSFSAMNVVYKFLETHPAYPYTLKNKILQASDLVRRAAEIKQTYY